MGRRTSSSGSLPTLCAADIRESFSEPFADGSGSLVIMDAESIEAARTIFQNDPCWRDYIPFHEYFHGDSGAGVGASHQTGWTGVVTKLMQQSGESSKRKKPEQAVATIAAD